MPGLRDLLTRPSLFLFLFLFLCLFSSRAGMLVLSPILPDVAREFGISIATVGQLRSICGATGGLTAVLLAVTLRRPGLRDLLSAGAAFVALGSVLSAAPTFEVLAAAQGALGIGMGLLVATGIAAAGEWPAPAQRAQVVAWAIVGMRAAWIAGMPIVGAVAAIDWRAAWLAVPMAAALATLVLVRLRPMDPARGGPAKPSAPRGRRTRRTSRPLAVQMATWSCPQSPEPNP
jgi:predicted MFS family arabinose efflux permease